ncbi:hypothetical protein B0H14DRAFT_2608960 [Mycena olivaceomarginata]|nr:hypothetical protein B0H14DRAFT_2608960 [Mycena olivaceomarginata]
MSPVTPSEKSVGLIKMKWDTVVGPAMFQDALGRTRPNNEAENIFVNVDGLVPYQRLRDCSPSPPPLPNPTMKRKKVPGYAKACTQKTSRDICLAIYAVERRQNLYWKTLTKLHLPHSKHLLKEVKQGPAVDEFQKPLVAAGPMEGVQGTGGGCGGQQGWAGGFGILVPEQLIQFQSCSKVVRYEYIK